jgi:PQQ-like domain
MRTRGKICAAGLLLIGLAACGPHRGVPTPTSTSPLTTAPVAPSPVGVGTRCPPGADEDRLIAALRDDPASRLLADEAAVERVSEEIATCRGGQDRTEILLRYAVPGPVAASDPYVRYAARLAALGWGYAGSDGDDGARVVDFCREVAGYPARLRLSRPQSHGPAPEMLLSLAAGCPPWPAADPHTPRLIPKPSSVRTYRPDVREGVLRWRTSLGAPVQADPVAAADLVITGTAAVGFDNYLTALVPATGAVRWRTRVPRGVLIEGADTTRIVYAVTGSYLPGPALLQAFDAGSGRLLWVAETGPA